MGRKKEMKRRRKGTMMMRKGTMIMRNILKRKKSLKRRILARIANPRLEFYLPWRRCR